MRSLIRFAGLVGLFLLVAGGYGTPVRAQVYDTSASRATIETAVLDLRAPEKYQVPVVLEASRRVSIRAADDGIVRELKVNLGDRVKRGHEVAVLDQAEAVARVEIAKAELERRQALHVGLKQASGANTSTDVRRFRGRDQGRPGPTQAGRDRP